MKRALLSLCFLITAGGLMAQQSVVVNGQIHQRSDVHTEVSRKGKPVSQQYSRQSKSRDVEVIWSSDFSDPSEWMMTDQSTPHPLGWEIITETNVSPVAALNPIGFEGAANGFAMVLADSAAAGESSFQNASLRTVNPIDLSGIQNVALTFQQVSRNWSTDYFFEYSFDGENWDEVEINTGLGVNENTNNPQFFYEIISDAIGGSPSVWIGFRYAANWGWFWAIDDVAIIQQPENDLELFAGYYNNWRSTFQGSTAADWQSWDDHAYVSSLEFTHMNVNSLQPLNFTGIVINNGSATQTNVRLFASVETPSGNIEEFVSSPVNLPTQEFTFLTISDIVLEAFNAQELGTYRVSLSVDGDQEDQIPSNDVVPERRFNVVEGFVGNDDADNDPGLVPRTNNRILGVRYVFPDAGVATHIRFALWTSTNAPTIIDEEIFPNVRIASVIQPVSGSNPASPLFEDSQMSYIVEEETLNTTDTEELIFVNIPLPEIIDLPSDKVVQAEIKFPPVTDPDSFGAVRILAGARSGGSFAAVERITNLNSGFGQNWYGLGSMPVIRLATEGGVVGTSDLVQLNFTVGQNYPNPCQGQTTIDWELFAPARNVRFSMSDLNGRTVYAKDLGDRPAGKQEPIMLDLNRLAAGTYQYGVTIGQERIVRKMVIVK